MNNWGQTDRPTNQQTNRITDKLLELLEWIFATKKDVVFLNM